MLIVFLGTDCKDTISSRIYCSNDVCKTKCSWKMKVTSIKIKVALQRSKSVFFTILRSGLPDHSGQFKEQIRGQERRRMQDQATGQLCDDLLHETMEAIETTQTPRIVPSEGVLKVIRSEAVSKQDFHKEILFDCISRKNKFEYIQEVSAAPFKIVSFESDFLNQIEKFKRMISDHGYVYTCFDATGNITISVENDKKSLYYCLAISMKTNGSKKGNTVHLASMISESHDQISIGNYF